MVAHLSLIYKQIRLRSLVEFRPTVYRDFTADTLIRRDIRIYCGDSIDSHVSAVFLIFVIDVSSSNAQDIALTKEAQDTTCGDGVH